MIGIKDQAFGLELEFSGMSREKAARTIAQVINGNSHASYKGTVYQKWEVTRNSDGRKWIVERDASVDHIAGGEPCEFVTPICHYEDIELIQECVRALRKAGAKVNVSCGIHIHVDGSNHTAKSLKNLAFTFKAKQDLLYKALKTQQRRLNSYCQPLNDQLINNIKKVKKLDSQTLRDAWYGTYAPYGDRGRHYNDSRYHALNLHSIWYRGTVEFRLFEATLHAGEIRAYINLALAMSAAAINAKRASAEVLDNGNDKYAMRCWLLRLGFIGDEWKVVRQHLLKNLEGNAAWRNDPRTYESYQARHGA